MKMTTREKDDLLFIFRRLEHQVQLAIKAIESDELVYNIPPKHPDITPGFEIGDFCITMRKQDRGPSQT